jgi:phage terminase large subunit-like protein
VVGRRGGKSRIAAAIGVYLALFRDYSKYLAPGEKATIPIISSDITQTGQILNYLKGMINRVPAVKERVTKELTESIELAGPRS